MGFLEIAEAGSAISRIWVGQAFSLAAGLFVLLKHEGAGLRGFQ